MTHLNIQQGSNVEVVTTQIIKKLYDAALSVPEPLEGEQDAAYMSGNLQVNKSYRAQVEYLTNRFDDLSINVTVGYYIPFEDSAVLNLLLTNNIGSDGIGVTEAEAANATLTSAMFKNNTDITSFDEFKYFTKANTNPPNQLFMGCSNLSSIDLSNVTALSSEEFRGTALTNVVLPENITTIPANWSSWTRSLVSVTAPGVQVITNNAFDQCSRLTNFSDFSNVTTIGNSAFLRAPLTGVFNAPNLTTLGTQAFKEHNFEGIECIGTVSFIPVNCFGHDTVYRTLQYVYLPYECTRLDSGSLCRALELTTIKQYDKTISDYQEGETKTFLPNLGKITIFGDYCFRECKALTLTNDDITNATAIGSNTFYQCYSLTGNISLPHLTSLGSYAFYSCTGITSVDITGSTINSIPDRVFYGCTSLTSFTGFSNITSIGGYAFYGCTLLTGVLNLPNLTGTLGEHSFGNTGISSISSLGSVTEIGERAFENTNISSITIPNSVKKCRPNIVSNTIVPEIIFPEGVEEITGGQFYTKNNSLTYIEIPSTVTNMGFFFHRSLENSQDNLCTIVIKATTPPELNYYSSNSSQMVHTRGDKFAGIYVPDSSLTAYQNGANAWQHSSIQEKLKPISQLQTDNPTVWAKYNRTSTV